MSDHIKTIQKIISKEFASHLSLHWYESTDSWEVWVQYKYPDVWIETKGGTLEDALFYMVKKLNES